MSDKKQVIHVKDLVIKADNVVIDAPERRPRPIFGFPGERREEKQEDIESSSSSLGLESDEEKGEEDDKRRPPFSWI